MHGAHEHRERDTRKRDPEQEAEGHKAQVDAGDAVHWPEISKPEGEAFGEREH